MDVKRTLVFAMLLTMASTTRADRVGHPDVDDRARPAPDSAPSSSVYVSPMNPNECQLGGRRFGCDFHPVKRRLKMHSGWDLQARPPGNPILRAVGRGKIVKAGRLSSLCGDGVQIQLDTGLYAYYCHMSKVETFRPGDTVNPGQTIGRLGQSGACKGPHLHFVMATCPEIGERCAVDPAQYLNPRDMCNEALPDRTQGKRC